MTELIKLTEYPVKDVLDKLLQDKSTKENIVFATDTYRFYGTGYSEYSYMTVQAVRGFASCNIQPRVYKSSNEQNERTRKKAEVFTPSWVVNKMNNFCDAEWFGRDNVFNRESSDSWEVIVEPVEFSEKKNWQAYVDSRRLEITCGEAPYITSRYDSTTGEIIDIDRRIGILDRKLRIVGENTNNEKDWLKWAIRAVESVYGYEFQGDNLLIARINVLSTFCDYLENKWHRQATKTELCTVANIIAWNFWQMDGLNGIAPFGTEHEEWFQFSFVEKPTEREEIKCTVYDWRAKCPMQFEKLKERGKGMKFDFVIGNPPYQETTENTSDKPVYDSFMSASYEIGTKVCLITPARFLFNAGKTSKDWNEKMLNDKHLKVLFFEQDSSKVFANTDIKGGVAITYRDETKDFGAIQIFTHFEELNSILKKVSNAKGFKSIDDFIFVQNKFNLDALYKEHPNYKNIIGSSGKERRLTTPIFSQLDVFTQEKNDNNVQILGLIKNNRVTKFISRQFLDEHENLDKYKVILPKSNGSGSIGEVLSTPIIGTPLCGYTQSFIGIGAFDTNDEAEACLKYIKSKFARTMLGVLKITQDNNKDTWKYVPLQDFTANSDIDWSKSIVEIDKQLYAKYGLSQDEIDFIETHVKEME